MSVSMAFRDSVYRAYMEFFDSAERKRRWNPLRDIPWEKLPQNPSTEDDAICAETFCGVELYVPDYTANGFNLTRTIFGQAWFQANWGYEESKHALTFREYLVQSGLRTAEQYEAFEQKVTAKVWNLPFRTRREMACYGALQEAATYLIYRQQHDLARKRGNEVLEKIYFYISRDEAAHMGFYRQVLGLEMAEDHDGTVSDLAHVVFNFQMPGVGLIPEYEDRLMTSGVGISRQEFLEHGIFPTLKKLGTDRAELLLALRKRREASAKAAAALGPDAPAELVNSVLTS
jgi:acyl-[acyl-carrier-protein] desaturase